MGVKKNRDLFGLQIDRLGERAVGVLPRKKKKKKRESRDGTRRPIHFGCPPRGFDRLRGVLRVRHSFIRGARIREDHSRIDPWFNFRATQYLADNGWKKFTTWFDHMSWYPLGRPVGSTIYPRDASDRGDVVESD